MGWDIPKLWIIAAQQRGTELGEAYAASLYCPLVKRNMIFKKDDSLGDLDLKPLNGFINIPSDDI